MTPAFNPNKGGVQRIVEKLGRFFVEQGHDVFYFSTAHSGHLAPEYGQLIHSDEEGGQRNKVNLMKLERLVIEIQPDVVLNEMPYELTLQRALSNSKKSTQFLLLGCLNNSLFSVKNNLNLYAKAALPGFLMPLFNNKIGHEILLQFHKKKHTFQLKRIIDVHDYFILPAAVEALKEELNYFFKGYKKEKIFGIPNSIPFNSTRNGKKKEKVLLFVGRLTDHQKRCDLLLEIWKQVSSELYDWRFEIVGDGPFYQSLEQQIARENIPRVTLRGFIQPDIFYNESSILVMPSAYEGFPSVLLEAQSQGVVPVTFNSYPAISWIVNSEKDAILVPAFDIKAMSNAIVSLAKDPVRRGKMMKAGIKNAGRFSTDRVGNQWLKFFEERRKEI